jgi:hypothetical protein
MKFRTNKKARFIKSFNMGYRLGMLGDEGMNLEKTLLEILEQHPKTNQVKGFQDGLDIGKRDRALIKENLQREQLKEKLQGLRELDKYQLTKRRGIDPPEI